MIDVDTRYENVFNIGQPKVTSPWPPFREDDMLAPTPRLAPRLLIRLAAAPPDKEAAIREAAGLLAAAGCIDPAYGDSMLRREAVANTCLGHGVVIPHGMVEDRHLVRESGLAVLQVPGGDRMARRAGRPPRRGDRGAVRSPTSRCARRLTRLIQDEDRLARLTRTDRQDDIARRR